MDWQTLTVPIGDPANVALRWVIAALIVVVGWFVVSFIFLPAYFGIRAAVEGVGQRIAAGAVWLFQHARDQLDALRNAFEAIALTGNLKATLVDQVQRVRDTAKSSARRVEIALNKFRAGGGGGADATLVRLNNELNRLKDLQPVGKRQDDAFKGLSMAYLRAILFTVFALALMFVNTALLNEFFRSLIRVQLPLLGIVIPVALVVSLLYTLVEFALGLALEVFGERDADDAARAGRFNPAAAMCLLFIFVAILVEVGLYGILSFSIHWPWPAAVRESLPPWIDGWLALMGFLIGGGVAISGYLFGDQWSKVMKFSAYKSMNAQADRLNGALSRFKADLPDLARKAAAAAPSGAGNNAVGAASRAEESAEAIIGALRDVQHADISEMAECTEGDANARRALALGMLLMTVLFIGGAVLLQSYIVRSTVVGRIGPWAPYAFAAIMAVAMLLFGWLASARFQASRTARGESGEVSGFEVRDHGLGVMQIAGLIGGLVFLIFGVSLATSGFKAFDSVLVPAAVALNLAIFCVGSMAESTTSATVFVLRLIWNLVLSLGFFLVGAVTGAAWIVIWVLEVVARIIAAPALWVVSMLRRDRDGGGPRRATRLTPAPTPAIEGSV